MDDLDLRPSPWPTHAVICTMLALAYGATAWSAWPTHHARPDAHGLAQLGELAVGIGEGAAMGAILTFGCGVLLYIGLSTIAVGHWRNPWLHGYALVALALVAVIAAAAG
jgi:hypothetical protein